MAKWRSLNDVINDDRDRKDFKSIPRYGESTSAQYVKPKHKRQYDAIKNILFAEMKYGRFYSTLELKRIIKKPNKKDLPENLRRYPELFENVGKGVWRLKE